jgi:hypothetical protein
VKRAVSGEQLVESSSGEQWRAAVASISGEKQRGVSYCNEQ